VNWISVRFSKAGKKKKKVEDFSFGLCESNGCLHIDIQHITLARELGFKLSMLPNQPFKVHNRHTNVRCPAAYTE